MRVLYSDDEEFDGRDVGIFLAGPTGVGAVIPSWRPVAIKILEEAGFEGTVLVPERKDWSVQFDYTDQVSWERAGLELASVTVFWVPRNMETMPALTTNVEFGYWVAKSPERVLYGRPVGAASTRYLDWLISQENKDAVVYDDLNFLLLAAVCRAPDFKDERTDETMDYSRLAFG